VTRRPAFAAAAGLAAALASPACAEDWYYIAGARTTNHFVDLDSVKRTGVSVAFRWQIISDDALRIRRRFISQSVTDCRTRVIRDKALETRSPDGIPAERATGDQPLLGEAGTVLGTLVDFVCARPAKRRAIRVAPRSLDAVADSVNASRVAH